MHRKYKLSPKFVSIRVLNRYTYMYMYMMKNMQVCVLLHGRGELRGAHKIFPGIFTGAVPAAVAAVRVTAPSTAPFACDPL